MQGVPSKKHGTVTSKRGQNRPMSFSLTTQFSQQYTYIPNAFIDTYMPDANGSFVKVYLYLLRHPAPAGSDAAPIRELPPRQNYTPLMAEALKKDLEISSCLNSVETLLGTTMSDAHMQLILYLMSDLGFSRDLILTLYETALARDKRSSRYIEVIALDWAKKGIRTPQEARDETNQFHGTYKVVATALGIKRPLAPAERAVIDRFAEFHFTDDILAEACNRTVLQSGDTNLNYTASILADWHKKGVKTLEDIKKCDKSFHQKKQAAGKKKDAGKKNQFQNFPQREYSRSDYDNLEKQLLQP